MSWLKKLDDSIIARLHNMGLAKVAVKCSAETFMVKIATFAKPENVSGYGKSGIRTRGTLNHRKQDKKSSIEYYFIVQPFGISGVSSSDLQ